MTFIVIWTGWACLPSIPLVEGYTGLDNPFLSLSQKLSMLQMEGLEKISSAQEGMENLWPSL